MKKIFIALGMFVVCSLTSCTREMETLKNNYTYTNPLREKGSKFTVVQNGVEIKHLKCIYWSTEDGDSVFVTDNGKKIFVDGSCIVIEE